MKTLLKWQRKLTARERKHIAETTQRATLAEFKRNVETGDCIECRIIARKLGLLK